MPLFTFYNFAVFSIPKIKHSSVSNSEILWENISLNWAQVLIFFPQYDLWSSKKIQTHARILKVSMDSFPFN